MNDLDYMKRAMALALQAKGQTSPNPMVGCVIVKNNKIIAEGYHHHCGGNHAEIEALKKAGVRAKGGKFYVTLEPCRHYGRTGPCLDRILESGIKEVVIGMKDPNPVNNGKSIAVLKKMGIKTYVGLLENELQKMNEVFVKYITRKMPFVVAKIAQTIDGKIATASGHSKWITSLASREFAHRLRNDFDAILVGANTVLADNPRLNAARKSKDIKKIIIDSQLKLPLRAKLFQSTKPENIFIGTTNQANKSKRVTLEKKGVNVIFCPGAQGRVDLKWFFRELARREISSILIEGGGKVIGSALKADLIDKFFIFIAPKIMGDAQALGSINGLKIQNVNRLIKLNHLNPQILHGDIFIEAYVHRNH